MLHNMNEVVSIQFVSERAFSNFRCSHDGDSNFRELLFCHGITVNDGVKVVAEKHPKQECNSKCNVVPSQIFVHSGSDKYSVNSSLVRDDLENLSSSGLCVYCVTMLRHHYMGRCD